MYNTDSDQEDRVRIQVGTDVKDSEQDSSYWC